MSVLIFLLIIAGSWYYIYVFYRNNNNTDVVAETPEIVEILLPQKDFSEDPERISAASNSVVMLTCYDKQGNEYCTGSGFSLFEDGIIITNYHVIQDNVYRIVGQTEQNQSFEIDQIIAYDAKKDIAILKSSNSIELNELIVGSSSNLKKGEKVVAIGSPLGLINSVSTGVFSGFIDEVLQFTASISNGSSGGALFNNDGKVIGVTFASFEEGQNLNLAVPIEDVILLWEDNRQKEMTIATFYESFDHTIPLTEILQSPEQYMKKEIAISGYISFIFGYVSNGDIVESIGLVGCPENVLGYTFGNEQWNYSLSGEAHNQTVKENRTGVEVFLRNKIDLNSFYETYHIGDNVVISGQLDDTFGSLVIKQS